MTPAISLLDRQVYLYSEVDRLVGLRAGTARRWINGYERGGKSYEPIIRLAPNSTDWATWGEFVETRILSEFRDQEIPTARLRAAVQGLRETFDMPYPLAHLRPYLAAEVGELTVEVASDEDDASPHILVLRTRALLLTAPSRRVINNATLAVDERGERFAAELTPDIRFPGIVINPIRNSGQPTFSGRGVSVGVIAGMVAAGESAADLAVDYSLSLAQVEAAMEFSAAHDLAA